MKDFKLTDEEKIMANILREEILKTSQNIVEDMPKTDFFNIEYISTNKQPYISPLMSMNEDEILDFVEETATDELAKLSQTELNHIGEVLGVDAKILAEGND